MAGRSHQLRIIGGQWRSRRLAIAPVTGLRPTSDRIRETLFNWLAPVITGARCLDLFAGSGALGIEALSRGAADVVFIEKNQKAVQQLKANLLLLNADTGSHIVNGDALAWLQQSVCTFDIVFLDPPFGQNILELACQTLESEGWLEPNAHIYLEMEQRLSLSLPVNWQIIRAKHAGQVDYQLALRQ